MGLITYKPTTPSYRKTVKVDKSVLFKGRPEKNLIEELQPNSGRNNTGQITTRHRSGGHKKKYRIINFKRNTFDKIGTVERIDNVSSKKGNKNTNVNRVLGAFDSLKKSLDVDDDISTTPTTNTTTTTTTTTPIPRRFLGDSMRNCLRMIDRRLTEQQANTLQKKYP